MSRSENSWRGLRMIRGLAGIRKLHTIELQRLTSEHRVVISLRESKRTMLLSLSRSDDGHSLSESLDALRFKTGISSGKAQAEDIEVRWYLSQGYAVFFIHEALDTLREWYTFQQMFLLSPRVRRLQRLAATVVTYLVTATSTRQFHVCKHIVCYCTLRENSPPELCGVWRKFHHKLRIDWNLDDVDHTKAMMMMIVMIMMSSIMMLTTVMTMILMITIMTMITIKFVCAVSLGNGYVRTSAFTLEHPHTELRAASYPKASPLRHHQLLRVSRYSDSRDSDIESASRCTVSKYPMWHYRRTTKLQTASASKNVWLSFLGTISTTVDDSGGEFADTVSEEWLTTLRCRVIRMRFKLRMSVLLTRAGAWRVSEGALSVTLIFCPQRVRRNLSQTPTLRLLHASHAALPAQFEIAQARMTSGVLRPRGVAYTSRLLPKNILRATILESEPADSSCTTASSNKPVRFFMRQFPLTTSPITWSSHSVPVRSCSDLRFSGLSHKLDRYIPVRQSSADRSVPSSLCPTSVQLISATVTALQTWSNRKKHACRDGLCVLRSTRSLDDPSKSTRTYDTNIMGQFTCWNPACSSPGCTTPGYTISDAEIVTELRTGSKSGAGSRWSYNTTHEGVKVHIKVDCVRVVKMGILRWYDWIVNALPTYEHTVVSDVTILSLAKLFSEYLSHYRSRTSNGTALPNISKISQLRPLMLEERNRYMICIFESFWSQYVVFLSLLYRKEILFRSLLLSSLSWLCAISPCVVFSTFARPNWANRFC
ncbi:hypothetical protein KCU89_g150, partial [Aureobasidium melanogenum]